MTVAEFLEKVRIKINDTDSIEFTNKELIDYLNEALRYVEQLLSENFSSIITSVMELTNSATEFPNEVLRIIKIKKDNTEFTKVNDDEEVAENTYKIFNNEIILGSVPCQMYYYKTLDKYNDTNETMALYEPLYPFIQDYIIIKCFSRLDYNLQIEEIKLEALKQNLLTMVRHRDGYPFIKRYDDYRV